VLKARFGDLPLQTLAYGEVVTQHGVRISLHPAGHVLGSAQIRLEYGGHVWVVSGDYKLAPDPTCTAFEPVTCDTFITESTFGLPIYRWPDSAEVMQSINQWWSHNANQGRSSLLYAYAFGKGQRLLAGLDTSIGPIITHGSFDALNAAYRHSGVPLPETNRVTDVSESDKKRALILAPPSAASSPWMKRFGEVSHAMVSGWMQIRGARRRRALDRGFVLSDHADWPALLSAIEATGAERIIVTHGNTAALIRWLNESGRVAQAFETEYGESEE
jgi:putative mRNA 3-end processing factor